MFPILYPRQCEARQNVPPGDIRAVRTLAVVMEMSVPASVSVSGHEARHRPSSAGVGLGLCLCWIAVVLGLETDQVHMVY